MKEKQKRWVQKIGMVFAALLGVAMLALLPYREALANVQGTVTASSAYIRASADVNSTSLASVMYGDKVEITEEVTGADNQTWYKVIIDADSTGYIRSDLVQKGEGSVPTGTTSATTTPSASGTNTTVNTAGVVEVQPVSASVTNDQVRVRADSSTNADIITTVRQSVALTVHGTKAGSGNDVWYYVSFLMDNEEVTGFIRSDYVTLNGELVPPEQGTTEIPEVPEAPVEIPTQSKAYETMEVDGVWYLVDNAAGEQYQLSKLFSASEQNATDLDNAQKKIKRQNGILIFLCILLVVLVLAVTVLIFKIRDMSDDDGFDFSFRRPSGSGSSGTRPSNGRPAGTRSQGTSRPANSRPVQGSSGSRPAGASTGSRPAGQGSRPAGTSSAGNRPAGQSANGANRPSGSSSGGGRPIQNTSGSRPEGSSSAGSRPTSQTAANRVAEEKLEKQAQADVEVRNIEKDMAVSQSRQSKNFLSEDDEFEFEFLNWDGEEEQ